MPRSLLSFTFALATATLIFFGAGVTPATAQPVPPEIKAEAPKQKQYPEVQEAFQQFAKDRNLKNCISALTVATRKYPELASPYVIMFTVFSQAKQANVARAMLEEAVKTTPSDPEPWVILGSIALQEGRVAEGISDFDKSKTLLAAYTNRDRKNAIEIQMLRGLAQVAEAREDWKDAEARMREILKIAPEDLDAHQHLARSLFWQTKAKDAYQVLKDAKKIDRENAKKSGGREVFLTPEAIMAQYYEGFENPPTDNPLTWFKAAVRANPDDLTTRQYFAIWALQKGKIDVLKEQAEAALRIEEDDAKLPAGQQKYKGSNVGRMLRGLVAQWQKDWPTAESYFQKILNDAPNDVDARNNLALALVEQDDQQKKDRALAYAQTNYRENNNSPVALATLGWVFFQRKQFNEAEIALQQALKASNNQLNPDMATYVAHILYHQDRKYQAKQLLENFVNSDKPFSMKPEAKLLYEKVKDATPPAATAKTP